MQIIPDTNFLIYLVNYNLLDSLHYHYLIIVKQVIKELEKISKDKKTKIKDRQAASIALKFLKTRKLKIIKQEGRADEAILALAKKLNVPIATMDREMIMKAKKLKIKIVKIRQRKYLQE